MIFVIYWSDSRIFVTYLSDSMILVIYWSDSRIFVTYLSDSMIFCYLLK